MTNGAFWETEGFFAVSPVGEGLFGGCLLFRGCPPYGGWCRFVGVFTPLSGA
jgi:hypothetical protein